MRTRLLSSDLLAGKLLIGWSGRDSSVTYGCSVNDDEEYDEYDDDSVAYREHEPI